MPLSDSDDDRYDERRWRLYGRAQGHKLSPRQARLFERLLPKIEINLSQPLANIDTARPLALEIGFGGGEHLCARAQAMPHVNFIGCEPFQNGVAKILSQIEAHKQKNIRLHYGDARPLLAALPADCVDDIYLLYPDPWPKKRHHKRRFVKAETLSLLHNVLKPHARLWIASDIADYIGWTLAHIRAHGQFDWTAEKASDWQAPPKGWTGTRYEQKALAAGRQPSYLCFTAI